MTARAKPKKQKSRFQDAGKPTLRPLCSAIAMVLAAGAASGVHAAGIVNLANVGARMSSAQANGGTANLGVGVSPQQALQASQPSIQNLARTAQGIAAQIAAQQQAAAAGALASANVPNGLAVGGLQVAPGVSFDPATNAPTTATANLNNASLWINANGPTQSVAANGHVTVDVVQTGQNAVATWQTMNVGKQTTLNFDQSGGNQSNGANNWVVLNRIQDPTGAPSQILGNVTAQGSVLVINRNGILFGAGSQVNVHSLIASSLDLLNTNDDSPLMNGATVSGQLVQDDTGIAASNQLFLQGGLAALEAGTSGDQGRAGPTEILGFGNNVQIASASQYVAPGAIVIAPGASITTHSNGTASDGGLVLVAAPSVTNGGNITATDGQVVLAAGIGVSLIPNVSNPQVLMPELTGSLTLPGVVDATPVGTLINTGIIQAARGNIDLFGTNVTQSGVIGVTTSVSSPGSITIWTGDENVANTPTGATYFPNANPVPAPVQISGDGTAQARAGQLVFGPGSVTSITPDNNGVTDTSAPGTTFNPGSIAMTAGSVWFQSGSLIEAPGSTVSVTALTSSNRVALPPPGDTAVQGRIYLDTGATIDVSGIANVELPISDILLDVPLITANELANSPLLRDGFLAGLKNVIVDSTLSGTNADGSQWVGSPILNLAGDVSLIPRTIDQLLVNGGTITLSGAQVMTADGSSLNLNGGYVHYLGGMVGTTRLIDADGAIVPIGKASPFDTYVGIAGEFIETHPRWGVTNDWFNALLSGGAYESDFIVGGNAGTLNVYASQAMVLDGGITAQALGGEKQVQGNNQPVGGSFNLGTALGTLGPDPDRSGEAGMVILQGSAPQLSDLSSGFNATTPLDASALGQLANTDPNNVLATTVVPVDTLNTGGFANVSVTDQGGSIMVAAGTTLEVQPGGSIKFNVTGIGGGGVPPTTILGSLIAPSGSISITNSGDIDLGSQAVISVAGQWVNNDAQTAPGTTQGDSEYINGGTVTLSTQITGDSGGDSTGSIALQAGSVIDVSSGGEVQSNGQMLMQNGIAEGSAGSLSLLTYTGSPFGTSSASTLALPQGQPTSGRIDLDGTIKSFGFAGGGTLTLQVLGFQIGGDPSAAPAWDLVLPASFFSQQGFGNYVLNGIYDTTVAPGTTVALTQRNLIPDIPALEHAATGMSLAAGGLVSLGTLDPYHRQATDLVMTAGDYLGWTTPTGGRPTYADVTGAVTLGQGASIVADAGASVALGSPAQVTVLGSIIAPGGSITLSADSLGAGNGGFPVSGQLVASGDYTSLSKSVWLGADAVLDVAGVVLTNPLAAPVRNGLQSMVPDTGKVLSGGSVTISDDSGYLVAEAGSLIDVSGTAATFDEKQSSGLYAPQPVWSDAGSVTLGASAGLYFDGTLLARPGAAQAQGGTLTLIADQTSENQTAQPGGGVPINGPGAQVLILQQSGALVPAGLTPGENFPGAFVTSSNQTQTSRGVLQFSVDRLAGSGMENLVVDGAASENFAPVPVAFAGDVALSLSGSVIIDAQQIVALSGANVSDLLSGAKTMTSGQANSLLGGSTSIGAPTITIDAPYVAIVGPAFRNSTSAGQPTPIEALADGTLNINASFIDLENQVQLNNFAQANFTSSGDIRLTSTIADEFVQNGLVPGALFTAGNLTFRAEDVYPSTGTTFILDAVGPTVAGTPSPTTVTFLANGTSGVPLSAGGTLFVDATDIVQSGTVRAPAGSLILGVGSTSDPSTQAEFGKLPIVATDSVSLTAGSVTSVSLDGAIVPFGTTVDGVEWQFNPIANANPAPDLTAPPSKLISVSGGSVSLDAGASIDLSGGGDLQAEEWVPGTGGTRDLLSQYNVSFATNPSGTAVPVNVGGGNVYAILPGKQSPVAAYDPVFAQGTQPTTSNGFAGTTTASSGVGQAALNAAVGESVYLSGVPGLPAGYYTLLPAKYATLPGAFRVTVSSSSGPITPGAVQTLPDGTVVLAGYMGNALSGSRSATPTLFDVQSGAVWQQYSQYTLTSANSFFSSLASTAGTFTPSLPMDAGQLVLSAGQALTLGGSLNTSAAPGGAPAEVDIASQAIQIVGRGEAALPGYLQLSAAQLDALDAGSLLIGGTRTQTSTGIVIDPIATRVVVSNDASDPLTGPELMLVSANSIEIDAGSVIAAKGAYPSGKDAPITIGNTASGLSGDGAFLSVTDGGDAVLTRQNTSGTGMLTIGAGATLTGGAALTLDSSGNLSFDPRANLSGTIIAVDGSEITFTDQSGAAAASLPGFVVGPNQIAQLANAQEVILRSAGAMNFDGTTDVTFGNAVDLSAGVFQSDGGSVAINAPQVTLSNEMGAPDPAATSGSGTLTVNATQINVGNGDMTVSGFGNVTMNATGGIVGQGNGTLDFGTLPVVLNAPVFLADTGSGSTIQTTGQLDLNSASGTALKLQPLGGALSFIGGTVNDNGATIEAPAGNVSLEATTGDLTVGNGALIRSAGVALPFFDVTVYAPAGAIKLTADEGTVNVQPGSTLDFSGANGGGAAGSLTLTAPQQTIQLAGTIKGGAATGFLGGSFSLDTGGAVDLDNLADELVTSGVNDAITVQTGAGNLTLSAGNTLTAHVVLLTANGGAGGQDPANGNVQILGTIDAAGNAGGEIDLYGKSGVDVEGSLIATGSSTTERGGTVNIGTTGNGSTTDLNSTYGYENILPTDAGVITLGSSAVIDVSGGSAGGLSGGTVNFRAPILSDGSVNVTISPTAQIKGSRSTTLEAYAVWSTDDQSTNAAQHFDGIVDPAGWYDSSGNLIAGTFTDQSGNTFTFTPDGTGGGSLVGASGTTTVTAAQLAAGDPSIDFGGLTTDFFVPATGSVNTNHETFYGYSGGDSTNGPGTLMGFVENGVQSVANQFNGNGIANFAVVPGIDLDNPDPTINHGDISILTNWNLGAGSSLTDLAFRFNGRAPIITFRAENSVQVKASLTDGFFQIANPVSPGSSTQVYAPDPANAYANSQTLYNANQGNYEGVGTPLSYYGPLSGNSYAGDVGAIGHPVSSNPDPTEAAKEVQEYYALYEAYAEFLSSPVPASSAQSQSPGESELELAVSNMRGQQATAPTPPSPQNQASNPLLYLEYLNAYQTYLFASVNAFSAVTLPLPPVVEAVAPITPGTPGNAGNGSTVIVTSVAVADNSPSPIATAQNPLTLSSGVLTGGSSASFRLVGGADISSADPLALQAASVFRAAGGGDVSLNGHTGYVDADNNLMLLTPTMIRTGTGSIDIAAANDVSLQDLTAPGVIYTAGAPASGAPLGNTVTIAEGNPGTGTPNFVVSPFVNPEGGGDISISAQNDIVGLEDATDGTGAVTGSIGTNLTQFWRQWLNTGNPVNASGQITQASIDFGAFDQGVMSVGGNVTVSAGGNITDLAVSLPTSWYLNSSQVPVTVGGGNLSVVAGGDIRSGEYFVANGAGTITAGGAIESDGLSYTVFSNANFAANEPPNVPVGPVSTVFATQDGTLAVSARQGADVGGVLNPSSQAYSPSSSISVASTTGDVDFGTSLVGELVAKSAFTLPATVDLTAFTGGITIASGGTLAASSDGDLNLLANRTINLTPQSSLTAGANDPLVLEMDGSILPSISSINNPVRIYSLTGSIVDGVLEPQGSPNAGFYDHLLSLEVDKPALIYADQDIVNLAFQGQNLREADVTRIVAARDIEDTPLLQDASVIPSLQLGGPGTFDIEAGRSIGPLTSQSEAFAALGSAFPSTGITTGIDAIGNSNNPDLPHESADIQVLFGVGPGINDSGFIASYIDPSSSAAASVPNGTSALVSFMERYDQGQGIDTGLKAGQTAVTLTSDQAWTQFQALPSYVQQLFVGQVFFSILTDVGNEFNNPSSPFFQQYARGFQAINTLFPAALGYTANDLGGGTNGANTRINTGNLDIRSTTIQTQQGGNISILGPGGEALIGSSSAPPAIVNSTGLTVAGPGTQGILTLEQGDIDIFIDQSLLLAQSRVFTEQGGNMTIWSSNGDINAGKGATSVADVPPPEYVCDVNHYCTVDARGEVTGAGIATLQTISGSPVGDVNLIAPRGTVDAGAAGIRVSGNINIAALHVLNADNIQVQGKSTGIPTAATVDTGALTAASATTSAVNEMAQNLVRGNAPGVSQRVWQISVEVEGFGDSASSDDETSSDDGDGRKKRNRK